MKTLFFLFSILLISSGCNKCITTVAEIKNNDIEIYNDSIILLGNLPGKGETVKWEVINDTDAHFINPNEPVGILKKGNKKEYSIKYEIFSPCGNTIDTTSVFFKNFLDCGDTLFYKGEEYPTTKIGNQCWFAKNLNIGNPNIGDQNDNKIIEKNAYNDDNINFDLYGGLYQWGEALNYKFPDTLVPTNDKLQGICPNGWHIPSYDEWVDLSNFLNDSTNAGGQLKSTSPLWLGSNVGANNATNFSALPGGYNSSNTYWRLGTAACFWSASQPKSTITGLPISDRVLRIALYSFSGRISTSWSTPDEKFSVRCIQD